MVNISDLEVGDLIRIRKGNLVLEGILMPRTEFSSKDVVIIKLSNGYNVGIDIRGANIEVIKKKAVEIGEKTTEKITEVEGEGNIEISMISTGGTIVSKVEYETGAVRPAITADELIDMVPEIKEYIDRLEVIELYRLFSEDITPNHWSEIAQYVSKRIVSGIDGVVVAHGTDTMSYTAAALAFSLRNLPVPVMFVGAQRSSDRPSTDAALNLRACPIIAKHAPFGEVVVVMHGYTSDDYVLAHRGVKVRKMHTSRRDAFQSINDIPLAMVRFPEGKFKLINKRIIPRSGRGEFNPMIKFDSRVALLKVYPNIDCTLIDYLVDRGYRGIVIEGTGLGHIRNKCIESIKRATEEEVVVAMTSQTLFGRINMKVYTTGRKLIEAGVLPSSDMLPETAYVKLTWLFGNYDNVDVIKQLYVRNLVNEINPEHSIELYPRWFHGDRLQ